MVRTMSWFHKFPLTTSDIILALFTVSMYVWASLVARTVKNLPPMQETWVWSLGWEDPLDKGMAIHFSILENSTDRGSDIAYGKLVFIAVL